MMTSKALVDSAVINSTSSGSKALADQLFAYWFNRLVYAQIWEDPQADLAALKLDAGARILCISSGGCNALAYLSSKPVAVHAVDLNGAHLAMLAIKKQAIRHLPDYQAVLHFLGDANNKDNLKRYLRHIRPNLPTSAKDFWEARNLLGKPRFRYFCENAYQHGLLGQFIASSHKLVKWLGGDLSKMMEARTLEEQQAHFSRYVEPVFRHPLIRWIARQPWALYSLGIPPAQFAALAADAGPELNLADLFKERMRHLACDFPLNENCFAHQAFARRYDIQQQAALPMYLQQQHFTTIRQHLDRLHSHHQTLTEFLQTQPNHSMDAYVLLDAQDWMDQNQLSALWREINRTAAPGARVLFRTGGASSPLEQQLAPELLLAWQTNVQQNQVLYQTDRSAIYGGMHLYRKA